MHKIKEIRPVLLSAPYADPETNQEVQIHLPSQHRSCGLVEITLENGIKGLGEGYLAVFAPRVFEQLIYLMRPYLIGRDVMDFRKIYQDMQLVIGYWSMQGAARHALSAVEIALQDCRARALDMPVYRLLGGKGKGSLTLYGSGGDSISPEAMLGELRYLEKLGIQYFKIRAQNHQSAKAIWCMQQGAARRINIAIDMTQNLQDPGQSVSDVVKFVNTVEQASGQHLFFVEEVLGPTKVKDYPLLRQQLNVKVAGGEIVTTPQELIERIASGTYDIVQPDATVIGGISAVTEVINTARRYITETVVHCWGGPVGMMANYHAALAGGSTLVEWPMPQFVLREAMVVDSWRIEKGQLWLSEAPGLGVELSPEVEQAFAFQEDAIYHCFARSRAMYQESQWLS